MSEKSLGDQSNEKKVNISNEDEIEKELEAAAQLKKMELNLKNLKNDLERKRREALQNKLVQYDTEKKKLASRLEEILLQPKQDDRDLKMKIIQKKKNIENILQDQIEKEEEIRLLKKEQEIERLVLKKIELEKIAEKKKEINNQFKKSNLELEIINEEKTIRDMNSAKILENALNTGGLLEEVIKKGALNEKEMALLSEAYLEKNAANDKQKELILEEIQAFKKREMKQQQLDNQEKIKKLNEMRFDIMEKKEEIIKQKAIHSEFMKKGIPFLSEIELGNAPPKELIAKNFKIDYDQYREQMDMSEFFKKGKEYLETTKKRIEDLKSKMEKKNYISDFELRYQEELQNFIANAHPESLHIARQMVFLIFDLASKEIIKDEEALRNLRNQNDYLVTKKQRLHKKMEALVDVNAMEELANEFIKRISDQILKESAAEIASLNLLAKTTALDIIFKSLAQEREAGDPQQLYQIFFSLRDSNFQKRKDKAVKFNFVDRTSLKDRAKRKKKKKQTQVDKNKRVDKNQDRVPEEEIINPQLLTQAKVAVPDQETETKQGSQTLQEKEIAYWEKIEMEQTKFIEPNKVKCGVSCLSLNRSGKFLIIGITSGGTLLYDVGNTFREPSLMALDLLNLSSGNVYLNSVSWSFEGCSQLLGLYNNGNVNSFITIGAPSNYEKLRRIKKDSNPFDNNSVRKPLTLYNENQIDWKFFAREKFKYTNEKESLKITCAEFFPSFTLTGFNNSIILGAQNGVIMKFNNNKSAEGDFRISEKFSQGFNKIVSEENQMFPNSINPMKISKNTPNMAGITEHIYREFFIGHQDPIIFIGYINYLSNIVTVDESGLVLIWNYSKESYYGKFQAFSPIAKLNVNANSVGYQESGQKIMIYPSKTKRLSSQDSKRFYHELMDTKELDKKIIKKTILENNKGVELLISMTGIPEKDEVCTFDQYLIDEEEKKVMQIIQQDFKGIVKYGAIKSVKGSFSNKFLYLQNIVEHKNEPNCSIVNFIGIALDTLTIKNLKIQLDIKKKITDPYEFAIIDEFQPIFISYLVILMGSYLEIYSLATGSKVKTIKDPIDDIMKISKLTMLDYLQVYEYKFALFASKNSCGIWRLNFQDSNDRKTIDEMLLEKENYMRLFLS